MLFSLRVHAQRHLRFYICIGLGIAVFASVSGSGWVLAASAAGNAFYASYLLSTFIAASRITFADLRRRAEVRDEGIVLIVVMTLAATSLGLGSLFALINAGQAPGTMRLIFAVLSIPLGWTTLHTVMALHYAHLYYAKHRTVAGSDAGGLAFPQTERPDIWDFFYYSFVIGMTAQVSDVQVLSGEMRRLTLAHAIVSFFYNTVIVALAVNIAVNLGQ